MIDALQRFLEAGHSELFECIALFLLPFAHEDVAILGGSLLVVEHQLPVGLALLSLYGGIVTSDFAIYGLGALMRRSPRIRRMLLSPRIDRLGHWLGSHTPEIVMMARLLPGLMFPLYLTCGLYRVSLLQFGLTTVLSAAIYLPIVFLLFSTFGTAVLSDLGYWAWILAIVIFAVAVFNWMRSPKWQFLLRVSSTGAGALVSRGDAVALLPDQVTHRGMGLRHGLLCAGCCWALMALLFVGGAMNALWSTLGSGARDITVEIGGGETEFLRRRVGEVGDGGGYDVAAPGVLDNHRYAKADTDIANLSCFGQSANFRNF